VNFELVLGHVVGLRTVRSRRPLELAVNTCDTINSNLQTVPTSKRQGKTLAPEFPPVTCHTSPPNDLADLTAPFSR
jgi:hypothetical protein